MKSLIALANLLAVMTTANADAYPSKSYSPNPYEKLLKPQTDYEYHFALAQAQEKRDRKAAKRVKNANKKV